MPNEKAIEQLAKASRFSRYSYFDDPNKPREGCACAIGELIRGLPPGDFDAAAEIMVEANRLWIEDKRLAPVVKMLGARYDLDIKQLHELQRLNDHASPNGNYDPTPEERYAYVVRYLLEEVALGGSA